MQKLSREVLTLYASLFVQRADQYAVQQRDGSYWRVAEPLTVSHLASHLEGRWTLGSYVLDVSSRCSFAVFDADGGDGLERLALLAEELRQKGVPTLLEASRRGGHLWVHLVEPTLAQVVRAWLLPYAMAVGVELYPKQDWLSPGGSGSLIRLPLGMHQQSRGWYPFLVRSSWGALVPVGQTVEDCCAWVCAYVQRVTVPGSVAVACSLSGPVHNESRMGLECPGPVQTASHEGSWEYSSIGQWCRSQDTLAVIGRYVALDHHGVGSCPFKEHHSRGDLFDFLCLYYHLTPQEAWQRVQQGGLL